MKATKLDPFTIAYIEAALWSTNDDSTPSGGEPLDSNYGIEDIAPETLAKIVADCDKFQAENADNFVLLASIGRYAVDQQAGHDFWLTRNGHGCGFWDGDWKEECGERLTAACELFGEVNLYVGDDGLIYS